MHIALVTKPGFDSKLHSSAVIRSMLFHPLHLLSLGGGSGLSPVIPGTVGTLFGWLLFLVLNPHLSVMQWWILIAISFVSGCGFTGFTAQHMGAKDPGAVVWDEIVAIWLVMLFIMPASFTCQFCAFMTFRFFDIVKPPPICYLNSKLSGSFGIMFDDIIAAFFTLIVITLLHFL
ncbi:phosphatidylglycerophosphatase A family protein [Candidatus Vallotiella sp. (ex Adelges kitamiensis)]